MIFLVRALAQSQPMGIEAWRWAFLLGAAGSLLVAIAFRLAPESPRWLAASGRHQAAEVAVARFEGSRAIRARQDHKSTPMAVHVGDAQALPAGSGHRRFAFVAAIYFVSPWATVAFPLLMGAVLIEKGFALSDSLLYVGISMFGPAIGTVVGALFVDRFERRLSLITFSIGMIAACFIFAASLDPFWLMAASIAFQVLAMLYLPTMTTYATELFPTPWRARTSTAAWSINRAASALAPLVLLPLLMVSGVWPMFGIIIGTLVLGIVVVAVAPNGKAGLAVD